MPQVRMIKGPVLIKGALNATGAITPNWVPPSPPPPPADPSPEPPKEPEVPTQQPHRPRGRAAAE